jgi:hypothetical protein
VDIPGALSLRAEQVDAYLALWPLLRGHPEISSLAVEKPQIRIEAAPAAGKEKEKSAETDRLAAYRRAMAPAVNVLREFAPDTRLKIEGAAVDLPGLELRELNVTARTGQRGFDIELAAASNRWRRLKLDARVEYADLSARADVDADELVLLPDLPAARVRAQLRTDANSAIEAEGDVAVPKLWRDAKLKVHLPVKGAPRASAELAGVDAAPVMALVRSKVPGLDFIESLDGRFSANVEVELAEEWGVQVHVVRSDASLKLVWLPWKISPAQGRISVTPKAVHVRALQGSLGDSSYADVDARIELQGPLRLSSASGRATLTLEQWFPWLRERVPQLDPISALSGSADLALKRLALRFDRPAAADYDALVTPRQVSVALKALPSPVSVSDGSVQVDASQLRLDKVAVAMLDARALVSGAVATKGPRLELAVADGIVGEKLVQWAFAQAGAPERLQPKTPLRVAAPRLVWGPGQALDAQALVKFDGGPQVDLALGWQPQQLDVRRLAIKDARSDAVLSVRVAGKVVQANFSGVLDGHSVAAMLRRPPQDSGTVRGSLRVTMDQARPERTVAEGQLKIEALDLSWLVGRRALIARADLTAQPTGLRIIDADVDFEEQKFSLSGQVQRTAKGPVVDARIESPGVLVERLLPPQSKAEPSSEAPSKLWPLPVTGRVAMRAGFVQYQRYRIEPFEGSLDLERERASFKVAEASMCGVSFPLTGEAAPESLALAAQISMKDQPLAKTMHCLTGDAMDITGSADLRADLRTQGKPGELVRNLSGTAQAELRQGSVKKFALIGNILSVLSLRNVVSKDATLREGGFPYRSLSAKGEFKNGEFLLEEGFFDSDAARIAASGRIDLQGANTHLDVLVGVLNTVDRVVGAIPIIGDIFGNTMLAIPISVNGDIRDPRVVPLGPRAITDRMLGIFERTLKLPGKLVPAEGGAPKPPP